MRAIHFFIPALLPLASATALAAESRCNADAASDLGLAVARALVAEDCRGRLQAQGAPAPWLEECPKAHATPVEREMLSRTSVSFRRIFDKDGFTRVELLFHGPDAGAVFEKMERTKACTATQTGVPAPCAPGFWDDIPMADHKGVIPLACTDQGKWRIASLAELAPAKSKLSVQPAKVEGATTGSADDKSRNFLLDSAAADFRKNGPAPSQFRNVRYGVVESAGGGGMPLICGEFQAVDKGEEWIAFTTLQTSKYEQYIGGQGEGFCKRPAFGWDKDDLSAELQKRFDALK